MFVSIYFKQISLQNISLVLAYIGVVFSITLFFTFAVERLPYPIGAIAFNLNYVTYSFLLFFISSLPLILMYNKRINIFLSNSIFKLPQNQNKKAGWEEATIEDVESGEFEAI